MSMMNSINLNIIEKVEYCFLNIYRYILRNSCDIKPNFTNTDLIKCISKPGRGRHYRYGINELLESYYNNTLTNNQDKELKYRIASYPFFIKFTEDICKELISSFLCKRKIQYYRTCTPIQSDYSIIIPSSEREKIELLYEEINNCSISLPNIDFRVDIDAKSIMAFNNLKDCLVDGYFAKHEISFNQTSYCAPFVREYIKQTNNIILNEKNIVLSGCNNNMITVTLCYSRIYYIKDFYKYMNSNIIDIDGSYFTSDIGLIDCIPNGNLECKYYDKFWNIGKSGRNNPLDARFKIYMKGNNLIFNNLDNIDINTNNEMDTSSYSEIDISDKMDTSPDEYICRDICRYYYIKKDNVSDYIYIPILYYGKIKKYKVKLL